MIISTNIEKFDMLRIKQPPHCRCREVEPCLGEGDSLSVRRHNSLDVVAID